MSGWTEDRTNTLKKLWKDGLSASQIAKQLGGVTRNGVIGKVHRLGLSGVATGINRGGGRPAYRRPVPRASNSEKTEEAKLTPPPAPPPTSEETKRILALPGTWAREEMAFGVGRCCWPVGDPSDKKFLYCGRAVENPTSRKASDQYCVDHKSVAFQPPAKRKTVDRQMDYIATRIN